VGSEQLLLVESAIFVENVIGSFLQFGVLKMPQ